MIFDRHKSVYSLIDFVKNLDSFKLELLIDGCIKNIQNDAACIYYLSLITSVMDIEYKHISYIYAYKDFTIQILNKLDLNFQILKENNKFDD